MIKEIYYKARIGFLYPAIFSLKHKLKQSISPILLIGTPIHKNLGDHLIAMMEKEILDKLYKGREIIEIPTDVFVSNKKLIVENTPNSALIIITGGGWLGSMWPDDELRMQSIIKEFLAHRIIVFPQTTYYNFEDEKGYKLFSLAKDTYRQTPNMSLYLRDMDSYNFAIKNFSDCIKNIEIFPDVALYRQLIDENTPKSRTIYLCLRKDRERLDHIDVESILSLYAEENNYSIKKFSTITKHAVPVWNRKKRIQDLALLISRGDVVITDRLHGMIFSALSGTKCIAIDNRTHKVSGVYHKWLYENPLVFLLDDSFDEELLCTIISECISKDGSSNRWREHIREEFEKLFKHMEDGNI